MWSVHVVWTCLHAQRLLATFPDENNEFQPQRTCPDFDFFICVELAQVWEERVGD